MDIRVPSAADEQIAYDSRAFQQKFNIGGTKMHAEIGAGRLKARYLGRKLLILHDDAIAWLTSLPQRAPTSKAA